MPTIVVFNKDGSVRINEGANEADFKGLDYLVDPKFPRGVPPHQWKRENGAIVGAATVVLPKPNLLKQLRFLLPLISGILIGIGIAYLRMHV